MIKEIVFCLLLILSAAFQVTAKYNIDSWTIEDGLPQNHIIDIIQTRDGYLWLTTFNGLARYDGVRFIVFNPGNTKELYTNRLWKLFEDPDGNLWITTENSGVVRYSNNQFKTYTIADGLPDNKVSIRLVKREKGFNLIFYSSKGAVKLIDEKLVPCNTEDLGPFNGEGYQSSATTVWHLKDNRLHKIENGRESSSFSLNGLSKDIFTIYEDIKGNLWLKMVSGELYRYKDIAISYPRSIFSFYEDNNGNLWACTSEGLGFYQDEKFTFLTTADGLLDNRIWAIYQDRENNLWVGTTKGLNCLRSNFIKSYSEKDGIANKNVYPIYQDRKGDIWIGSLPGLTKYSNGVFTNQDEIISDKTKTPHQPLWVMAIMEDRDSNLWFGLNNGFARLLKDGKVVTNREGFFYRTSVIALYQDHTGTIWLGTDKGLIKFKEGIIKCYTTTDGLTGNFISAIYEDSSNNLWIGTQFGLSKMVGESFHNYGKNDGLTGYLVRAIYEDSDHTLWVGTYDGGLNRIKDGKIISYTTKEGLYDNGISQILEDNTGNFWMSSNLGIYRVKKRELNLLAEGKIRSINCVAYNKSDGMLASECNGGQPAGIKTKDGHIWFPTINGIAVLDPATISISTQPPLIVTEEILVDKEMIQYENAITLERFNENLEIHYTCLSFLMPGQCKFKYKLAGLDRDWIDAGTRRTAYYSHIPPGEYLFTVIGANRDGVWNLKGRTIFIKVVPPFWRTWWFSTLLIGVVVTTGVLFYKIRVSVLKQKHKAQQIFSQQLIQSQERERKRLAAELHDSLAQSLLVIKHRAILTLRAHNKSGNIIEHINEISTVTDLALNEVSELSYNLRPYQLDKLGLVRAIEAMLERVSGSSGITFSTNIDPIEKIFSQQDEISIYRIIQECVNNIIKHSNASNAQVKIKTVNREINITISDNGKGFILETINSMHSINSGFGLTGIAERARMLGGKYQLESKPGEGTKITIQLNIGNISDERANNSFNS